jgi:MSHA pilin protein MshD
MFTSKSQQGISLVELILFIIIVSVALAALVLVLNVTIKGSVDPLIHKQALAIAESLLEEVELQDFSNPTGGFPGTPPQAIQVNRALFDDVMDYNGFATTGIYPADGSGIVVTGLTNYNVRVAVVKTTVAWGTIPAGEAAQITVTVTDPGGQTLEAVGYRVNY